MLKHKPNTANVVANALSKEAELASISKIQGKLLSLIKKHMEHDIVVGQLLHLVMEGKTKRFWVGDDLLYTKGHYV